MSLRTRNLVLPLRNICRQRTLSTSNFVANKHIIRRKFEKDLSRYSRRTFSRQTFFNNGVYPTSKLYVYNTEKSTPDTTFTESLIKKQEELHKKLESRKPNIHLNDVCEQIYSLAKNSSSNDEIECRIKICEKLLGLSPKILRHSFSFIYGEFLRHLTQGYYYTALVYVQLLNRNFMHNEGISTQMSSCAFENLLNNQCRDIAEDFFHCLLENENDAEKIGDLFNRYCVLANYDATREVLQAILESSKRANKNESLYDRFMIFKEIFPVVQNSKTHHNFIEGFLCKSSKHMDYFKENDRRKVALNFILMGYDLSFMNPGNFYLYFFNAFAREYKNKLKTVNELLENFFRNMQSYNMKSWVVWELLNPYINGLFMQQGNMNLDIKNIQDWLDARKDKIFKEKEEYETEVAKNCDYRLLDSLVYDENFEDIHKLLTTYGWPKDEKVLEQIPEILAIYLVYADWSQTKFFLHMISDKHLNNTFGLNNAIVLTKQQLFDILHKRFNESEDFSKICNCLYELNLLFPFSFNNLAENSDKKLEKNEAHVEGDELINFFNPFYGYMKNMCRYSLKNPDALFEFTDLLEKFHLINYAKYFHLKRSTNLLCYLFRENNRYDWHRLWNMVPKKMPKKTLFFRLLRQYYYFNHITIHQPINVEQTKLYHDVFEKISEEAKTIFSPSTIYFMDMFAIIAAIDSCSLNTGCSVYFRLPYTHWVEVDELYRLLEYKPIPHESKKDLFHGLFTAIFEVSQLFNASEELLDCLKFALKHPLIGETFKRNDSFNIKSLLFNKKVGLKLEFYNVLKRNKIEIPVYLIDQILQDSVKEKSMLEHYIYNKDTSVFNVSDFQQNEFPSKKRFDDLIEELRLDASRRIRFPSYDVLPE